MSFVAAPHQDLFGLSRIAGQAPTPVAVLFTDFLAAGVGTFVDSTAGNAMFASGGVNPGTLSIRATAPSGILNIPTSTSSGDCAFITTATLIGLYTTGAVEGTETGFSFFTKMRLQQATAHVNASAIIGLFNDDGAAPTLTADVVGAVSGGTAALTNGFGFMIASTTGAISTITRLDNGSGTYAETAVPTGVTTVATQAGATSTDLITFGIEYDGKTKIRFYINDKLVDTRYVNGTNVPATNMSLFPVLGVRTNTAAASNMHVDWVYFTATRNRPNNP